MFFFNLYHALLATEIRRKISQEPEQSIIKYPQPSGRAEDGNNNYLVTSPVSIKVPQPYVPPGQAINSLQQESQGSVRPEFRSVAPPPQSPKPIPFGRPAENLHLTETLIPSPKPIEVVAVTPSSQTTETLETNDNPTTSMIATRATINQSVPWRVQRSTPPTSTEIATNTRGNNQQQRQSQIDAKTQDEGNQTPTKPVSKFLYCTGFMMWLYCTK